ETINNNPPVDMTILFGQQFDLNTDNGVDTVNILNTKAGVLILVNGSNQDTVNVGENGSVQGIVAPVTLQNPTSHNTINIDDSADAAARSVLLGTFVSNGALWGEVAALAPATIYYRNDATQSLHVTTGVGADNITVAQT